MTNSLFRETLSAPVLLRIVLDCLMSALAMFGLKYALLLRFDRDVWRDERARSNLRNLYAVTLLRDGRELPARLLAEGETPLPVEDGKSVRSRVDRAKARQRSWLDWKPPPDHPWRCSLKTGAEAVAGKRRRGLALRSLRSLRARPKETFLHSFDTG